MDNNYNEIEGIINMLKEMENKLNDDSIDDNYNNELNGMLTKLNELNDMANINFNSLNVKIKKLHPDAVIPTYAKDGDAGMDLVATEIVENTTFQKTYGTGLAMQIPYGYVGLVFPRSSIRKYNLELSNSVGVIDSGYRGEIRVVFNKTIHGFSDDFTYNIGDRIAQIIIIPYPKVNFVLTEELSDTERGSGGFGSTGT